MVSVVVATRNRCDLLRQALDSLTRLDIPPGDDWELVVVDNHSTDGTPDVIAQFQSRLPIRCVVEPVVGLSRARNTGARNARGELLLFTDDDVIVDPRWLIEHTVGAARWPDAWYFAGPIDARFEEGVPRWIVRHADALGGMLSARDLGEGSRLLAPSDLPWGPNMAIRRMAFLHSSFAEDMGRSGGGQLRGSEDSFFLPLQALGAVGAWTPGARVQHVIPKSRANLRYLCRYYYGSGRASARLYGLNLEPRETQRRKWRRALRQLVTSGRNWPRELANVAKRTGRLVESRRVPVRAGRS